MPTNWSRRFKNHVEKLKSGDIYQVAEVVRNLAIRRSKKHLSPSEKTLYAHARNLLVAARDALVSPFGVSGIPIRLTTFAQQDPASSKVQTPTAIDTRAPCIICARMS